MTTAGVFSRDQVLAAFRESALASLIVVPTRETYHAATRKEALRMVRQAGVHEIPYTGEGNCADYAELLRFRVWQQSGWRGLGLVCDFGGRHVYNCAVLIDDNGGPDVPILEPQTGRFAVPGSLLRHGGVESYDCRRGVVWL